MEKMYFDIGAFVILCILFSSMYLRKMNKGKQNQWFIVLLVLSIFSTIADIGCILFDNIIDGQLILQYIFHTVYLYAHNLLPLLYMVFLLMQTDTAHKVRRNCVHKSAFVIPITIITVCMVANFFNKKWFYISEEGSYVRGDWFAYLYLSAVFYMIYGIVYLSVYRKTVSKRNFVTLMIMYPAMALAAVIQFINKDLIVEMFANAGGLLFISIMVQRPEEILDVDTGMNKLSSFIESIERNYINNKSVKIIGINIVNYNSLYDMLGHKDSNEVIRIIRDYIRGLDKSYRFNADLYYLGNGRLCAIIEEEKADKVEEAAKEINEYLKSEISYKTLSLNIIACVCIVSCPEDIKDADSLIAFGNSVGADMYTGDLLYATNIYKENHYNLMREMDDIIERGLANKNFSVHYQPIYSIKEKRFTSAEALVRLIDEKYGFVSPGIFIPEAEKNGSIHRIGEFVLEEVCKFIASDEFKQLGVEYIEVNLSAAQCMRNNLAQMVTSVLKKYNVAPNQINLEITETAATYSQKVMNENLEALHKEGIPLSLDDFGTGYSNIRRIASMPFSIIKIDRSMTDIEDNKRLKMVVETTIKMIKAMNMQIVVEGIETENLANIFAELDCEYIQGYFYSKPLPKDEFIKFLLDNERN